MAAADDRFSIPATAPEDLAHHVRLDYETVLYGKTWYDWGHWFEALGLPATKPAGALRFSHYDQVIAAACAGGGVAIGAGDMLLDARLGYDLLEGDILEVYAEADNLGDVRYEEVPGVPLPGRTFAGGVRLTW